MSLASFVVQIFVGLAPTFIILSFAGLMMSWLRLLVDAMSGKGM